MAITNSDGSIILSTKIDQKGITRGLGDIQSKAKKAFFAIGAMATTATVAITKMAVSAYADYEQLVGGVETLFKGSAKRVMAYAENAFYTAGVSANEYMKQVTSFSAALIRSTAGDTDKAADVANMALQDISDNVNKMGSSMESVQLAYQGFARQQYLLLDNLKLGYGGTKTEMERLLKDAEALTDVKYDINNLADVYSAIHAIQEELGITGTTAKEAEKTITGSANMMKAAWENVLSAIAGGGDLDRAINNLVYSIQKYFENIAPVVEKALYGIATLIAEIAPKLIETVAKSLIKAIPMLLVAIYNMIIALAKGIYESIKALFTDTAKEIIDTQIDKINETAESQKKVTEEVKKTNKELKKTLANFDEISILAEKTEGDDIVEQFASKTDVTSSIGQTNNDMEKSVTETLGSISSKIKGALLAIGVILLLFGNIPFGIGFIIAGAVAYGVTEKKTNEFDVDKISNFLSEIDEYIAPSLLAIGLILLILGHIPIGVGFIVAGAIVYSVKEIMSNGEYDETTVEQKLGVIAQYLATALLAIGAILIMLGHFAWGVGFLIGGAAAYKVSEATLGNTDISTELQVFFEKNKKIIDGIAIAMFLIGLILIFSGLFGVGLGMLAGSAGLLYSKASLSGEEFVSTIKNFVAENADIIIKVSAVLAVIGIALCFVPGMLGLGLAMVASGIVLFFTGQALSPEGFSKELNKIGEKIKPWLLGLGALLVAVGILLCCTGAGLGLGLAMVLAGGGMVFGGLSISSSNLSGALTSMNSGLNGNGVILGGAPSVFVPYETNPVFKNFEFDTPGATATNGYYMGEHSTERVPETEWYNLENAKFPGAGNSSQIVIEVDGMEFARTNQITQEYLDTFNGGEIIIK